MTQNQFPDRFKGKKIAQPKKPVNQLWRIEDGITYSALSKWMECPEQFSLQWIDGLTPKRISIPLEFGSIMHYGLEHQFRGHPKDVINKITEEYRRHRSKTLANSKDRDTLNFICSLAEITFPQYCHYWSYDDSHINWIAREQKFKVKYNFPSPEGGEREVHLRGMRDGLYEYKDKVSGEMIYGVFETKNKSRIVESEIMDNLHADMQTMLYVFSAYLETGRYPNQVKYNVIRRADLYRRKNEQLHAYMNRVENDIISRPEHYFKRYTARITSTDIHNFVTKTLNPVLNLFVQWYDSIKKNPVGKDRFQSPYHYLNSTALVGKYGKAEMWDAIFGNLLNYNLRTNVFPELSDSFQVMWDDLAVSNATLYEATHLLEDLTECPFDAEN
jgi:hypothetical protein